MKHPSQSGFTLIEVLAVTVVVGILVGLVMLSIDLGGGDRQLREEARRTQAVVQLACETALIEARHHGIAFHDGGYMVLRDQRGAWVPVAGEGPLRSRDWTLPAQAQLRITGRPVSLEITDEAVQPQVVCFSGGELTPFELELEIPGVPGGWLLSGRINGELDLSAAPAPEA